MSWLRFFRKNADEPVQAGAPGRGPAINPRQPGKPQSPPASGYGANPYDTYTWELHTDPEGERELKRAHMIDRPKQDGEAFNPYDSGKFSGGW